MAALAPMPSASESTATPVTGNGHVTLDAKKSWITSAGEADSYIWSSRPLLAEGASTIWLVPAKAAGLRVVAPFRGRRWRLRGARLVSSCCRPFPGKRNDQKRALAVSRNDENIELLGIGVTLV